MIRATYRVQFHRDFTFADAEAIIPYLERLGISHIHASPITMACEGSTSGEDVVDPTQVDADLGEESGLRWLAAALQSRNMGLIADIVPGHVCIAGGRNPWWNDVVEKGRASHHARYFDVDWSEKLVLPLLDTPFSQALASGALRVVDSEGELLLSVNDSETLPLVFGGLPGTTFRHQILNDHDPGDPEGLANLRALIERQSYRLVPRAMANDVVNWRRAQGRNDLAALRVEDEAVFDATHALYFRLYSEGLINGVRIIGVDGLADPAGYCRMLRERFDAVRPGAWIVARKALSPGEALADWGLDGTDGGDFAGDVAALLHDQAGEAPLKRIWQSVSGRPADPAWESVEARRDTLSFEHGGALRQCAGAFRALVEASPAREAISAGMIERAVERLLWVFPTWRTYGSGREGPDGAALDAAWQAVQPILPASEAYVARLVLGQLAEGDRSDNPAAAEAARRFAQLSAEVAERAVAGTAFARNGVLLSGAGSPHAGFALPVAAFHAAMERRAQACPHAMLSTGTHAQPRGEDMRARLAVLSELPSDWAACVERLFSLARAHGGGIHSADQYLLFQAMIGAWPDESDAAGLGGFAERIGRWQVRLLRDARLRSSWEAPDEAYEERYRAFARTLLDPAQAPEFLEDATAFLRRIAAPAQANLTVQTALRHLAPGISDMVQGAELSDIGLGDTGHCAVDFKRRQEMLIGPAADGTFKIKLVGDLLQLRKRHAPIFLEGDYRPLVVEGPRSRHVLAFTRSAAGQELLCAVQLHCASALTGSAALVPPAAWWEGTRILAAGGSHDAADCFADMPLFIQVR